MRFKNLLFDRDGVINEVVIRENGLISSPRSADEYNFKKDFLDFIPVLEKLDVISFVVSNQPDIGRGLMTWESLFEINNIILNKFKFTEIVCCTDSDNNSPDKKPNPGMILKLIDKYNLNPGETVMIGDMWKDIIAAKSAGIKSVYVKNSHSDLKNSIPDFTINNLSELINILK